MISYRVVVEVDKITREVIRRYKSVGHAGNVKGSNKQTIYANCKNKSLSPGNTYFRYEQEFDKFERFRDGTKYRPVVAMAGNKVRAFYGAADAAEVLGVKPSTITSCICHGQKIHGIEFRYLNTKYPETIKDGSAWAKRNGQES